MPTAAASGVAMNQRQIARASRLTQLLDCAGELVLERGVGGFTMEGLAARAGVSKALPYRHFSNAEAVLVALYQREIDGLGAAILDAVGRAPADGDAVVRSAIRAYFDHVAHAGGVLAVLTAAGSSISDVADGGRRQGPNFVAELLERAYGLRGRGALVAANLVLALVIAGAQSWGQRDASRETVERLTTLAVLGAIHSIAA